MIRSTFWYQSSLISRGRLLLILDSSSSALPLRASPFLLVLASSSRLTCLQSLMTSPLNSAHAGLYSRTLFTIPNPPPLQISSVLSDPLTVTSITPADTISTNRTSSLTSPSKIPFFAIPLLPNSLDFPNSLTLHSSPSLNQSPIAIAWKAFAA